MFGGKPFKQVHTGREYGQIDLTAANAMLRKLGNLRATPPLRITNGADNITIGMDSISPNNFCFAILTSDVLPNGHGTAQPYIVNNVPDGDWIVSPNAGDAITVYAPPGILNIYQYYPASTVVCAGWFPFYMRWCILFTTCGNC